MSKKIVVLNGSPRANGNTAALTAHLGWTNVGIVYAGGNFEIGDIQGKPAQLAEAKALGATIGVSI